MACYFLRWLTSEDLRWKTSRQVFCLVSQTANVENPRSRPHILDDEFKKRSLFYLGSIRKSKQCVKK